MKNIRKKFWAWAVIFSQVYAYLAQATSKLVESDDFQSKPFYNAILTHSQRMGLKALYWVKTHGLEFFDSFCALARLASMALHVVVQRVGMFGNSICLTDKAAASLPKLEAHIKKLYSEKAGSVSTSVGKRPSQASLSASSSVLPQKKAASITEPSSIQDKMTLDLAKRDGGKLRKLDKPIGDPKY